MPHATAPSPSRHGRPPPSAATARGWAQAAEAFRQQPPYCADPFGVHPVPVPGSHVDHIVPRSQGGSDDWANLQTLSASCHSQTTATYDGGFGNARTLD